MLLSLTVHNTTVSACSGRTESSNVRSKTIRALHVLSNHFLSINLTASLFSFEALYIAHICLYKQTKYFLELCLLLLPASLLLSDLPVIHQLRLQRLFACVFTRRLICYDLNLLYQHIVTGVVLQSVCLRSILE